MKIGRKVGDDSINIGVFSFHPGMMADTLSVGSEKNSVAHCSVNFLLFRNERRGSAESVTMLIKDVDVRLLLYLVPFSDPFCFFNVH